MLFYFLFLSSFFYGVILTNDNSDKNTHFAFDIKQRIALFLQSTKNEKAKEMEQIEQTVSDQINKAIGLMDKLLKKKVTTEKDDENFIEFGSSSSTTFVNLPSLNRNANVNPFRKLNRRSGTRTDDADHGQNRHDYRTDDTELEQHTAGIDQDLVTPVGTSQTISEQQRSLNDTRKKLVELKERLEKVGIGMRRKTIAAESPKPTETITVPPKLSYCSSSDAVADHRLESASSVMNKLQITKGKTLDEWKCLMESIVVNMEKLFFYADQTRPFVGEESSLLSRSLNCVKQANDRPLKSCQQIVDLLNNALHSFDAYKTNRKQPGETYNKEKEIIGKSLHSDQSDSGSERNENFEDSDNDTEMGLSESGSATSNIDQYYDIDHWASTEMQDDEDEHNDDDYEELCDHDAVTIPNDSGPDSDDDFYHTINSDQSGSSTAMTACADGTETDHSHTDLDGGSTTTTDHFYHSEILSHPTPNNNTTINKEYSSDGELVAMRKIDLSMDNQKNNRRQMMRNDSTVTKLDSENEMDVEYLPSDSD